MFQNFTKICFIYRQKKYRKMLTRSRRRRLEENGGLIVVYSSYDKEGFEPKKKRKITKPTVSDLKREMGMYGLPTEGKKQDLQKRLASHLQKPRDGTPDSGHISNCTYILCLLTYKF